MEKHHNRRFLPILEKGWWDLLWWLWSDNTSQPQTRQLCHWLNPSASHCTDLRGGMDQNSFTCQHTCFGYHSWEQICRNLRVWLCIIHQVLGQPSLSSIAPAAHYMGWSCTFPATHPGSSNCSAEMCFTLSQSPPHPSPLHQHPALNYTQWNLLWMVPPASK